MEGASVAQVAQQEGIPYQIVRVISDSADDTSPDNFESFIAKYNRYSPILIKALIENINNINLNKFYKS